MPYSAKQIYDIVMDIESYPEFLPWCVLSRIVELHEDYLLADLVIKFGIFKEQYRSKVSFSNCTEESNYCYVNAYNIEGPFEKLATIWNIKKIDEGVEIEILVEFSLKSSMLDIFIGQYLEQASDKMINAFEERAKAKYG